MVRTITPVKTRAIKSRLSASWLSSSLSLSPPFSSHCSFFVVIPHQSHARYTLTSNLSANHISFVKVAGRCNLLHYKVLTFRFSKQSNTFSAFIREENEKLFLNVYQSYLITCNKLTLLLEHFHTIFIPFLFHFCSIHGGLFQSNLKFCCFMVLIIIICIII